MRREKLITDCADRRATRAAAHKTNVEEAIIGGLHDAWAGDCSDEEYRDLCDRPVDDAQEYLDDADEMRGYLDRPIGKAAARLCAALGLDPGACEPNAPWLSTRPAVTSRSKPSEDAPCKRP